MILLVSPQTKAKKIDIKRQFDHDIGQVLMDSGKMKQVILNLLSNAVDFSPEGGKIVLVTKNCTEKGKPEVIHIDRVRFSKLTKELITRSTCFVVSSILVDSSND